MLVSKTKFTFSVSMGFLQILRLIKSHPDRKAFLTKDLKAAFEWMIANLKKNGEI